MFSYRDLKNNSFHSVVHNFLLMVSAGQFALGEAFIFKFSLKVDTVPNQKTWSDFISEVYFFCLFYENLAPQFS